jgi:hypothetical protein
MFTELVVSKSIKLLEPAVAGVMHYSNRARLMKIVEDDDLELEREPNNEYDKNAIRVAHGGAKLGYVPRELAQILAPLMDAGLPVRAVVGDVIAQKGTVTMNLFVPKST